MKQCILFFNLISNNVYFIHFVYRFYYHIQNEITQILLYLNALLMVDIDYLNIYKLICVLICHSNPFQIFYSLFLQYRHNAHRHSSYLLIPYHSKSHLKHHKLNFLHNLKFLHLLLSDQLQNQFLIFLKCFVVFIYLL